MKIKEFIFKLKNILLIIGVALIGIGCILNLNFNYLQEPVDEVNVELYTLNVGQLSHPIYGILPVRIDATLYIPKLEHNCYLLTQNYKMPAIVFVHGFSADKTFLRGLAFEFGRRGFLSISISARGHGASGGVAGLTWENETLTAVDYLEMLADSGFPIDKNRIGLVGHSMGAFSVTIAASMDSRVNATIAIGGPVVNITRGFGFGSVLSLYNMTGGIANLFNLKILQCLMPGLSAYMQYPVNMFWALDNAVIEGRVNGTVPNNYLNIIGTLDEAFSVYSAQEVLWYMGLKDNPYNISHYVQVLRNNLYGDFNGTARKLVVLPTTDHVTEHMNPACCYEAINWMEKSMKLTNPLYGSIEYWIYQILFRDFLPEQARSMSMIITILGIVITFIPLSVYLGNWLKSKYTNTKSAREMENKKMLLLFLVYGIAFCSISAITMPVIEAFHIVPWTDYLVFNILHMLLFVQAMLFIPALIVILIFERWKYKESLEDFGIHPKAFPKSALYGILLALFIFTLVNLASTNSFYDMLPARPTSFLEIFMTMLVVFSVSELLFRGLIQTKLSRYDNTKLKLVSKVLPAWKEFLLSSLITGIIQGLGVGIVASMFIDSISLVPISPTFVNLMMMGQFQGLSIPDLPLPILICGGCIGLFFVMSLMMNWLYRKSRNVMGLIILGAFFISWLSTATPLISGSII